LDLVLISEANVNDITPDQDYYYIEKPDIEAQSKLKYGIRYFTTIGNLDLALSYVDGVDPRLDAALLHNQIDMFGNSNDALQRSYHRERSPGVDLQYNFGSYLGKLAYAGHYTEDSNGSDASIKNSWHHLAIGTEFNIGSNIINLYTGTKIVEDFDDSNDDRKTTNLLMGQSYSQINFVSGHVSANFLTGNALSTTILFAGYWNPKGEMIQYMVRPTLGYKLIDSLQVMFSPSFLDVNDTSYQSLQLELKYSF
jgi:hypothetical protein